MAFPETGLTASDFSFSRFYDLSSAHGPAKL